MKKNLTSFPLKIIAIVAMTLNHIGQAFHLGDYSEVLFFGTEFIGKLTFPIMAYLLVEGAYYTRSKWKYAGRLAIFWLLSIYPFHLIHAFNSAFGPIEFVNNIFFTLLMGLILIIFYEKTTNKWIHIGLVVLFSLLTIMSDWNLIGVIIIFGFYRIKNPIVKKLIPPIYATVFLFSLMLLIFMISPSSVPAYIVVSALGILMVIPLLLKYNGKRGYSPTWLKWGFYAYYPLHLLAIFIVKILFF
ncbi:TraX family protein [Carnobacterium gallinarum]|uniref:TraX family protein n=1 Tax=Carnobacterium gallinarum TaxID=2749 RepID=UPI000551F650|nr:TraX family protein [Carnobacterium gallinarum]